MSEYANADQLKKHKIDPTPQLGDIVKWVSNGIRWSTSEDDFPGGCDPLVGWDGWSYVVLLQRGDKKIPEYEDMEE